VSDSPPALAVILVSWNVRDLILDALRTLDADLRAYLPDTAIWVVDNASHDGSAAAIRAAFPHVHLIESPTNLGFGGGNNVALRALGFTDQPHITPDAPPAVFLLNSDTRIVPGAVRQLYETLFSAPDIGIVGAQLEYGDGSFQDGAFGIPDLAQLVIDLFPLRWLPRRIYGRLYRSRLNGRYPRRWYHGDRPFAVGHTLGATMMMRREAIAQTGLFDESFFMYCEEIDWTVRIQRAGWRILCEPRARVVHLGGQSTSQIRAESLINLWHSRLHLFDKYYPGWQRALARRLIRIGAASRCREAQHDLSLSAANRAALITAYTKIGEMAVDRLPLAVRRGRLRG